MKINSKERIGNTFTIEIEEEYDKFEEFIQKALTQAGREIRIPGFRQGKAPKNLVEKSINREYVEAQAAQDLISNLYPQIIKEAELEPVDFPKIDIIQQTKDNPFVFKLEIDVYPEVKLGKYKGLKVDKTKVDVTDDDVEKVLGNMQQRFAKPGADGKPEILPLDDEFAKKVSRHQTLAELRAEVKEALLKDKTGRAEAEAKDKLIAMVSKEAQFEVPKGMLEREIDLMMDELRSSIAQSGLNFEDYLKAVKKDMQTMRDEVSKTAELRIKGKIVLREVAKAEDLKIEAEEIEEELKVISASSGEKLEDLKNRVNDSMKEYMEDYMLRKKALDFIEEKAKIHLVESKKEEPHPDETQDKKEELK
ncbi:MAG: trigger factor [bacterium]